MSTKLESRIRLIDLSDWGYSTLQLMQRQMESEALSDGSGRWVPVPYAVGRGVIDQSTDSAGILLRIEFTSDKVADISWMAAKAYSYALYCGCIDQLRRRSMQIGRARFLGAGSTETVEATLGDVRMAVRLTVIDPAEVEQADA
jgi:hypothetical protein